MGSHGYKKYMKREEKQTGSLFKIFIISFFGMLLFFSFVIKSIMPSVDTSIGDYKEPAVVDEEEITKKIVDGRLEMIQEEDQGRSFSDLMAKQNEKVSDENVSEANDVVVDETSSKKEEAKAAQEPAKVSTDTVYKVFIGSYTSAEQAKVAKDIITESGTNLNPIVKCIGSNNYTLQVGIFKNKQSAESLLYTIQQNHLPGRIVQEG